MADKVEKMFKFQAPPKGKPMYYPYTFGAALTQFPYRWHWHNERVFRMLGYSLAICLPFFYLVQKAVNSQSNRRAWQEIRAHREHTRYDVPTLPNLGGHH